ncbi:MAG: GHKL domain-containing protein [Flavobacteriales bacterium]|nr:GHKL domain-containing protein [Flavobacteriales bacterium]
MAHLVDSAAILTPEEALVSDGFAACTEAVPRFGLGKAAHWVRFSVFNQTAAQGLFVSIPYFAIDELDVFMVEQGKLVRIAQAGLTREKDENGILIRKSIFHVPVPVADQREVLLRVRGFKHLHLPVFVGGAASIQEASSEREVWFGIYAGIMLVLALYNLFVFFSIRDKTYFFYVLSTVTLCATQLSLQGYGPFDLFPTTAWWTARAPLIFNLLTIPLGLEFARRFINTKQFVPTLHRWTPLFYVLLGITAVIYLAVDPWAGQALGNALSGLCAVFLLTMIITSVIRGSRQARFFLLAWTGFLIGVVLFVMKDEGAIPFSSLTVYAMPIGSAIEGVLLSFGLADRINILRREKEQSQALALEASLENERIIREQNVILEQKVQERTKALQESNDHLKRTQTQLVNAEKMASLGQLTAGIAHEINNPVNFISSNIPPLRRNLGEVIDVLKDYREAGTRTDAEAFRTIAAKERKLGLDESIEELGEILGSIEEGSKRTADIVRGLRNFSRLDEDDLKPADLNECLRSTVTILGPQFRDQVVLDMQPGSIPRVECYAGKLNQVFMNMLNNAAQAVRTKHPAGLGRVTVSTAERDGHVVVSIRDNGVGMSDAVKARIFDPFFTTKDVGEGTGLGLSIAYSIVEKHHGRIEVESAPGEGTEFRVLIPLVQPQANEIKAQRA